MKNNTTEFRVPDMKCEGCVQRVTNVLNRLEGVGLVQVTLDDKSAKVDFDEDSVRFDDLRYAIEKAGYSVEMDEF